MFLNQFFLLCGMRFKAKKVYGSSKILSCPFCKRTATQKNEQGLDVCFKHTKGVLQDIKCTCGTWLELRVGKFGPYFHCLNCGNLKYSKAMEIKEMTTPTTMFDEPAPSSPQLSEPKEVTITSDDHQYFD